MFRALVRSPLPFGHTLRFVLTPSRRCVQALGLAALKKVTLSSAQEEREADLLLGACREALCTTLVKRNQYPEAVMNIKTEMKMDEYCRRIQHPGFWGGEAELLILVTMLKTPVTVFLPNSNGALGFVPLVTYGKQFEKTKAGKERKPVKLLYSNGNQCVAVGRRLRVFLCADARCRAQLRPASVSAFGVNSLMRAITAQLALKLLPISSSSHHPLRV